MKKTIQDEAISFFLHACTSGLYGEDRGELEPAVQEVLLELEDRLQHLISDYRAGCYKQEDTTTGMETVNSNTTS